jgi:hypothetical protein
VSDGGAAAMVEWLREAADEIENAHRGLDLLKVPRVNPETGNAFTLAARIAYMAGVRE